MEEGNLICAVMVPLFGTMSGPQLAVYTRQADGRLCDRASEITYIFEMDLAGI